MKHPVDGIYLYAGDTFDLTVTLKIEEAPGLNIEAMTQLARASLIRNAVEVSQRLYVNKKPS